MKKICKFLGLAVLLTAIGETVASYKKDEKFKEKLNNAQGLDKVKVILDNLVDVNKGFLEKVKEIDYKSKYEELKNKLIEQKGKASSLFLSKVDELSEKVSYYKEKASELKKEKIEPIIKEFTEKAEKFKEQMEEKLSDIKDKVKVEEKIKKIKEDIKEMKEKFSKKD